MLENTGLAECAKECTSMEPPDAFPSEIVRAAPGFSFESSCCTPLSGGRNNRAYRLETSTGTFLLKIYRHDADWDRLATETRFLDFCAHHRIQHVPKVLCTDARAAAALHSWLGNAPFAEARPSSQDSAAAAAFIQKIAAASRRPNALANVLPACDACLCLRDYFRSPIGRITDLSRLLAATPHAPYAGEALKLVEKKITPLWQQIQTTAMTSLTGMDLARPFAADSLLYSPSDFGFHNTVRLANNTALGFVDFEYAGLDDPVKLICDYQCQADVVMPDNAWESLLRACADGFGATARAVNEWRDRIRIALPPTRVKFICIVLNVFKKYSETDLADSGVKERRETQLAKAERMCADLERGRTVE